jgi:hypothetical protein
MFHITISQINWVKYFGSYSTSPPSLRTACPALSALARAALYMACCFGVDFARDIVPAPPCTTNTKWDEDEAFAEGCDKRGNFSSIVVECKMQKR